MTLSVSIRHGPSPGAAAATTFTRMLMHSRLAVRVCGSRQTFSSTAQAPTPTHGAPANSCSSSGGPPNSGPHGFQHQLPLRATQRSSHDSCALLSTLSSANRLTKTTTTTTLTTSSFSSSACASSSLHGRTKSRPSCSATTLPSRAQTLLFDSPVPRRLFSSASSYPTMAAMKLDGNAIAKKIRERLAGEVAKKQENNPRYKPCLKIIQGLSQSPPPLSLPAIARALANHNNHQSVIGRTLVRNAIPLGRTGATIHLGMHTNRL